MRRLGEGLRPQRSQVISTGGSLACAWRAEPVEPVMSVGEATP